MEFFIFKLHLLFPLKAGEPKSLDSDDYNPMDFQLSKVSSLIRELAVSTWMIISERIV